MVPDMRKPAARAASGRRSPSSQAAWCGSPQAICTTSMPRRSPSCFSSGTLLTCRDQLHAPRASGSIGFMREILGRLVGLLSGAGGGFDVAAERAELGAVGAVLVERLDLFRLQLGPLLRPGPDHRPARVVGQVRELVGP